MKHAALALIQQIGSTPKVEPFSVIEWCNDNNGVLLLALTFVYVVATIIMAILMLRSNQLTAKIFNEETRPYLVFNIQAENGNVYAILKNISNTPAFDVTVEINPKFKKCTNDAPPLLNHTIGMIAPGQELRDFLHAGYLFHKENALAYNGDVKYLDSSGNKYTDPVSIDISYYPGMNRIDKKSAIGELQKIAKTLEALRKHIEG